MRVLDDQYPVGTLANIACLLEVAAPKPGNVHPGASFRDLNSIDFQLAAAVTAAVFEEASRRPLGDTILDAARRTQALERGNINLGIILLLSPIAALKVDEDVRAGIRRVLSSLDAEDSRKIYEAIRTSAAGGLGTSSSHDIQDTAPVDLIAAMRLAENRDLVARQYSRNYEDLLDTLLPLFTDSQYQHELMDRRIVRLHLQCMQRFPDSLISRKCGVEIAEESARRARTVLAAGWPESTEARRALDTLDKWLRSEDNRRNPGTTADMVAATLFLALRTGLIRPPLPNDPKWYPKR